MSSSGGKFPEAAVKDDKEADKKKMLSGTAVSPGRRRSVPRPLGAGRIAGRLPRFDPTA
ncbi:hypothetical protein [Zavarzinella formosa]|uniref:hypothetical protein n=1 Tax=Zavarzinella formosa TaxID=360055 RepID=UPI0012F826FE|nr:hypothetical protein [Zavarzinella formosa]